MRVDLYAEGGYSGGGITENGGNISGALLLAGNPSQTLEAVPKQYVDAYYNSLSANNLVAGTLQAARLPNLTGDLQSLAGTSHFTLNNSGVTAGEYGKVTINAKGIVTAGGNITDSDIPYGINWDKVNPASLPTTLNGYGITNGISVNGGTLSGFLSLTNQPTTSGHAATKAYVDGLTSHGGIDVGDILRKPYTTTPAGFLKCNGGEVDKTTYADLYAVIGDNFSNNSKAGSGKPWNQQYQINQTQTEDITGWSVESTSLYYVLYYSQVVVTKNRVYLLGGWNGSYISAVIYAPINADGSLGTWVLGTALPGTLALSQAIVTKNRVYLIGGATGNGASAVSVTYTAPINADGSLGTWTAGTSLPGPVHTGQAIVTKNRVYLLAGYNNSTYTTTVYTAPINTDGVLGAWTTGTPIASAAGYPISVVTKNRVYLIGGWNGSVNSSVIQSAPINADGTLGSWAVESISFPIVISATQAFVSKNKVYIIGGNSTATSITNVYTAEIKADGTLGTWAAGTPLTVALNQSQIIATKNRIYCLGGMTSAGSATAAIYSAPINGGLNDYSDYYLSDTTNYLMPGSGHPWEQQYQINTTQSTDISGWTTSTALPSNTYGPSVFVTKNRVYVCGGSNGSTSTTNVYVAAINADGTLGSWSTDTALSLPVAYAATIITKNRVYLLGGHNGSAYTSAVLSASINSDGTLGAWVSGTAIPAALSGASVFTTKNRVYLMGGYGSAGIYTAVINSDGTLGTWSTNASIPVALHGCNVFITKNRVYIVGGATTVTAQSAVYTATINSDGLLGTWDTTTSFPVNVYNSAIFVSKNKVYIIAGSPTNSTAVTAAIYSAVINEDGTIGAWVLGTSIPSGLCNFSAIAVKNRIYTFGGFTGGGAVSTVYTASISSSIQDYSPYYDGTIIPVEPVTVSNKFSLPDLSASEPFGSYSYIKY